MTTQRTTEKAREILRIQSLGISQRSIAEACHCSRNTVREIVTRNQALSSTKENPEVRPNNICFKKEHTTIKTKKAEPDYSYIHGELARKGVTMTLLWSEYLVSSETAGLGFLKYSQFCQKYHEYSQKTKATMHITHKPGDTCSVDWAGTTLQLVDRGSGEIKKAYLFVGTLDCSKYSYTPVFDTL